MDLPVLRLGTAVALVFGGVGLLLGIVLLWRYLGTALFVSHLLREDPIAIADLPEQPASAGRPLIQGTASIANGKTVRAPLSETDCLAYAYEIQERQDGRLSHLEPIETGADSVPFLVDDGTGVVLVDSAECEFEIRADSVEPERGTESLAAAIADSLADAADSPVDTADLSTNTADAPVDTGERSDSEREYVERRLDVGQSVLVYGRMAPPPTDEWGRNRVVASFTAAETPLVVSDRSTYGIAWRLGKTPFLWSAIGAVSLFYGLSMLLYGLWLLV